MKRVYNNYILLITFITLFTQFRFPFFIYRMRKQTSLIFKNVRTIKRTARRNVRVGGSSIDPLIETRFYIRGQRIGHFNFY